MKQSIGIVLACMVMLLVWGCDDTSITSFSAPDGDGSEQADGDFNEIAESTDDENEESSDGDNDPDSEGSCVCGPYISDCCDGCDLIEGYCLIHGACISDGEVDSDEPCLVCDADADPLTWTTMDNGAICDDDDACSTRSNCREGVCTAVEWIENDCTEHMECGWSPSGCFECGTCDAVTQACWECDSSVQSCWPGDGIDTKICAPDEGGSCGDMSGLQAGSPWPMYAGCPSLQGRSDNPGPAVPSLRWAFKTEGIAGSPVLGQGGTVYLASYDKNLYAIHPDGQEKWRFTAGGTIYGWPALRSDGSIIFGSSDGILHAVDEEGEELWTMPIDGHLDSRISIGGDGTIYLGGGTLSDALYAVTSDGSEKWRFTVGSAAYVTGTVSPSGTVYVGSNRSLHAIDSEGNEIWSQPINGYPFVPAIGADGILYFGTLNDEYYYAISPEDGIRWRLSFMSRVGGGPTIGADGTIYFPRYNPGMIAAVNPDGSIRWKYETEGDVWSTPTLDADGVLYFGTMDGYLNSLDSSTGGLLWRYATGDSDRSSVAIGKNSDLYFGSYDGYLYALGDCREGDPCMEDRALDLDGAAAYATLSENAYFLRNRVDGTVECWFMWLGSDTGDQMGVIYGEGVNEKLGLGITVSGAIRFGEHFDVDGWQTTTSYENVVTKGIWHHLAAVKSDGMYTIYLNGLLLNVGHFDEDHEDTSVPGMAYVGYNANNGGLQYFHGLIDELRVSSTARYTEDFEPAYRHEPDENTIGLWHFDVGRDKTVFAAHGKLPPGSLKGSAVRTEDGGGIGRDWLCATGWKRCSDETTVDICNESGRWVEWRTCEGLETCQETGNRLAACME